MKFHPIPTTSDNVRRNFPAYRASHIPHVQLSNNVLRSNISFISTWPPSVASFRGVLCWRERKLVFANKTKLKVTLRQCCYIQMDLQKYVFQISQNLSPWILIQLKKPQSCRTAVFTCLSGMINTTSTDSAILVQHQQYYHQYSLIYLPHIYLQC